MDAVWQWGLHLIEAFQSNTGGLLLPMQFFTFLGFEYAYMAILPFVYWCLDKALATHLLVLLAASNHLNGLVKAIFKLPRPFWFRPGLALSAETSFGLPSGHSMNAVAIWGYLAYHAPSILKRKSIANAVRWLAIAAVLLISISRLFLGMHFPEDVLSGWILGILLLVGYIRWWPSMSRWLHSQSMGINVLLAATVSLATMGLYALALRTPAGSPETMHTFIQIAEDAARENAATLAGMIFGMWVGLTAESRYVRFRVEGPALHRALRYVAGMAGVGIVYVGLKLLLPGGTDVVGVFSRVVRYASLLLWATWLWPLLFVRLGWASADSTQ